MVSMRSGRWKAEGKETEGCIVRVLWSLRPNVALNWVWKELKTMKRRSPMRQKKRMSKITVMSMKMMMDVTRRKVVTKRRKKMKTMIARMRTLCCD
jgi:hypothetical protein